MSGPLQAYHQDFEYYEGRAAGLLESARDRTEPAVSAFAARGALLSEGGARTEVAGERGTNGNDLLGMAGATGDLRLSALLLARGGNAADRGALLGSPRGDRDPRLRGRRPANLRAAAGLGDLALIEELLHPAGRPAPRAGAHRGFYRPHGGFPARKPSSDGQEVLDEALAWAARSDRADALDPLVVHGAQLEADVYQGTALAWAAATGRAAAIRRLVALGADPSGRSTFGGADFGRDLTPLHLAADDGKLDALRTLLELGADPTLRDAIYDSTPHGWAQHFGRPRAAELLAAAGG